MSSISLNFKKGVDSAKQSRRDRLKTNKWLMGLLVAIPLAGGLWNPFGIYKKGMIDVPVLKRVNLSIVDKSQRIEQATDALVQVGLSDSCALVNHPALVLADEPTGALDSTTSEEIVNLLTELNQQGTTIAIVTHNANVVVRTKRIIRMVDGVIVGQEK